VGHINSYSANVENMGAPTGVLISP